MRGGRDRYDRLISYVPLGACRRAAGIRHRRPRRAAAGAVAAMARRQGFDSRSLLMQQRVQCTSKCSARGVGRARRLIAPRFRRRPFSSAAWVLLPGRIAELAHHLSRCLFCVTSRRRGHAQPRSGEFRGCVWDVLLRVGSALHDVRLVVHVVATTPQRALDLLRLQEAGNGQCVAAPSFRGI